MILARGSHLYIGGFRAEDLAARFGTPLYVYDAETMIQNYGRLFSAIGYKYKEILYSCKANSNPWILRIFRDLGAGLDAVSPWEVLLGVRIGFPPSKILFTGSSVGDDEMRLVRDLGVIVNIDSLSQLKRYGRLFPGSEISIRINPGFGAGHHDKATTGGLTKFGIYLSQVSEAMDIIRSYSLRLVGLHAHIGSGILDPEPMLKTAETLLRLAERIGPRDLGFIDIGGGLGIPYRSSEKPLDIGVLGERLTELFEGFSKKHGADLVLRLEPGRYLVGNAGVLLVRVVDIKEAEINGIKKIFIGTDSGMNHLIRPALYGAHHEVIAVGRVDAEKRIKADVVGNICESGDILARDVELPEIREGDVLAIMNAGAYGYSMASNYNLRPRPAEVLVDRGEAKLIRRRETVEDMLASVASFPL